MAKRSIYRDAIQPRRGTGAPSRTRSHYDAILALLHERGPEGVLASELYDHPHLYGRSPRNRISELRRDGFVISGEARGSSDWHYVLVSASTDWYERVTGKPRPCAASAQEDCFVLTPPEPRQ
jgi:hypothetical protein